MASGLVTKEELQTLPRWAIVAFAARCARRVLPLVEPKGNHTFFGAISRSVEAAESAASAAHSADAIIAASVADHAAGDSLHAAAFAAAIAAAQAAAAAHAHAADNAADAADNAARATAYDDAANAAMRRDFELLVAASKAERWTDKTPVGPEFFGPLWPDGEPPGWGGEINESSSASQTSESADTDLSLKIRVVPGGATAEDLAEFYAALADLFREHGGVGLTIDKETESFAAEGVTV